MSDEAKIVAVAQIAHEVNRAYCAAIGDTSQPPWDEAPDWQKNSAVGGAALHWSGKRTPEESHAAWMAEKEAGGWVYGPEKNAEAKTHPCMVPYEDLPLEQRVKDYLFAAVVESAKRALAD